MAKLINIHVFGHKIFVGDFVCLKVEGSYLLPWHSYAYIKEMLNIQYKLSWKKYLITSSIMLIAKNIYWYKTSDTIKEIFLVKSTLN